MAKKQKTKKSTKKKATKTSKPTLAAEGLEGFAAVTHTKCFTDPSTGERWISKIGAAKDPDGAFTIGDGASFQGHHNSKGNVHGKCLGNGMQIWTDDGAFFYTGTYTGGGTTTIEGKYFKLSLLEANLAEDGNLVVPGDDWEADKET
jgi:hypothetical protein